MALSVGSRLGHYTVIAKLGEGGMGEVWEATDTTLNRQVALKILPEAFAADPDRLARFQREAQVLASLNHPGIAAIYGIEESDDTRALVLELVEGPTLADRIAKGPIPIDEALPIAKQIAEALEAAHEAGVIHRDLKPANIKVREDGTVKVLDFGLAKALDTTPEGDPSQSPTLTAAATQMGVIMGTAAYMSPEQARGKPVDKRADIWAFGAVLFEILTGTTPFPGDDISQTLARVIDRDPDWDALPRTLSPTLATYLRRCLRRGPKKRIRDMGDVRLALEGAFEPPLEASSARAVVTPLHVWQRPVPAAIGVVAIAAIVGLGVWSVTGQAPVGGRGVTRLALNSPDGATPALTVGVNNLAISSDGDVVVYPGEGGVLFARALERLEPTVLTGAGGIRAAPFFSPDGQWVGFFRGNLALQTVGVTGGPVTTVASLQGAFGRGATWGGNDTIIFATTGASGLQMVDANGELSVLTVPDTESGEADHLFPSYLPGEQAVLFTIAAAGGSSRGGVAVLDLTTETYKLLISGGSDARYLPTGHLVYVADNTLRAVPFDRARLEVANTASVPVVPGIATTDAGEGFFDISLEGTLAYSVDVGQRVRRTLVWLNRRGEEEPLGAPDRAYLYPRLSPDGSRVALDVRDEENDIWMWDIQSQTLSRFTTAPGLERFPVWATDGSRVFFTSDRLGTPNLFARVVDGGDNVERLSESSTDQAAMSTSPDGQGLVFREGGDLLKLSLGDEPQLEPLVVDPFFNGSATVSPDGRWLAYSSDESGQLEVYVRPWTGGGERRLVSMHGGRQPVWNPAGGELFFFGSTDELMGVEISPTTDEWRATTPTVVLRRGYAIGNRGAAATYDVSPDGERFLMIRSNASRDSTPSEIIVVQNWHEELKRLVPVD